MVQKAFVFSLCILTCASGAESRILIPVKINDQQVRFIFDTGADQAFLWHSTARRLGLRISPPPPNAQIKPGQVLVSLSEPVKLDVLSLAFPSVQLAVIENPPQPVDFDGAIGWPNLRKNRVSFHGQNLHFESLAALPPETAGWLKLRERTDWNNLSLELPRKEACQPAYLGIDTGNPDGVFLTPDAWIKWRAAHPKNPTTLLAYFMPGAGLSVTEVAWADEIDLEGVKLNGVPIGSMNSAQTSLYPPGTVAVIGLAALRRMDMMIDGEGGIYVRPSETQPPAYNHNRLGAVFMPAAVNNDALLARVVKDSPAGRAGIRDGDVLLKIDHLDVTLWRTQPGILPLSRFWQQPSGVKLHLTLMRQGKVFTADVVLRNILGPENKIP